MIASHRYTIASALMAGADWQTGGLLGLYMEDVHRKLENSMGEYDISSLHECHLPNFVETGGKVYAMTIVSNNPMVFRA